MNKNKQSPIRYRDIHPDELAFDNADGQGLTKRQFIASLIMAGLPADIRSDTAALIAVHRTDCLIEQLNKEL